ncbi:MAG: DUF485 domain-containing protein [Dermatophilus congolensis]|nr:DUF485 domain-containing protein [Dermatophilus congolensis]
MATHDHDPPTTQVQTPYQQVQASPEFQELRRKFRAFVFPCTIFFLVWYFLYVILAAYFPEFMSIRVAGNINVGLIFGLLQFVTTFTITIMYVRWADRVFDPAADRIRDDMTGGEKA